MIMDIKQYLFPQMKQLQGDRQQEEEPFQQTESTNDETSLNETNTNSTVRILPRRSKRQRRPPDRYTITQSHKERGMCDCLWILLLLFIICYPQEIISSILLTFTSSDELHIACVSSVGSPFEFL